MREMKRNEYTKKMPKSYKVNKCTICLNTLGHHIELSCGHCFHHECIKKLFIIYMDDKCPLCKNIYTYLPSRKPKSRKRLKNKLLKKYSNYTGRISRLDICKLGYYLSKHKVYLPFIEIMITALQNYADEDINYIKYTNSQILMYECECDCQAGKMIIVYNNHLF